jgi:uncharacterized protein (TIGR03067 family)
MQFGPFQAVSALAEGVLKAMLITQVKTVTAVLLVLGMFAFGGGLLFQHTAAGPLVANEKDQAVLEAEKGNKAPMDKPPAKDQELLQGAWKLVRAEWEGKASEEKDITASCVIKDNQILLKSRIQVFPELGSASDLETLKGIYQLKSDENPKKMIAQGIWEDVKRENEKGFRILYQVDGNTLKLVVPFPSPKHEPGDFQTGRVLIFQREKKAEADKEKSAPLPPNRWEKLLLDKDLTAKQRAAYEQIAKLRTIKLDSWDWGSIPIPSFVKDSKLPTDVLFAMGLDALPMLAEALDDETPTATVITQREGGFKQVKVWKVNDFAALLIVRIADRDFVIGEFPKELGIRDIAQRPKAAPELRKLVVAWHGKFAAKTPAERKIADVTDAWFRNRFDAIIWLGWTKTKDGRAPIMARVDEFYADKKREESSLTRTEMTHCALALGQIGDRASLPQVRRVCTDLSHTVYMAYRPSEQGRWAADSGINEDLFRAYDGLALLGEKDEALKELKRLLATYGAEMEASTRKDYEKRLKAAEGEAPLEAEGAKKGAAVDLQFHPSATATDLKIELTTAAKATRPHKAIYLTVKVSNLSSNEILTGIAREWGGGKAPAKLPGTGLYASIAPAKDKKAPAFEPAYLAGDGMPGLPESIKIEAMLDPVVPVFRHSADLLLRMDWPGAGFVPARQFPDEGGSYKVQVLLVFQKTGKTPQKLQYVISEPATVEVPVQAASEGRRRHAPAHQLSLIQTSR